MDDKLAQAAKYHFKRLRTECTFSHIVECKEKNSHVVFYALFTCKNQTKLKKVTLTQDGEIV